MSDVESVLRSYRKVLRVCGQRRVRDPETGKVLSAHQAGILSHLDRTDPVMVTELADFLGVTPSTMSLTLKRLEAGGFIRRARDPADRRVVNVRLTARGARVVAARAVLDRDRLDAALLLLDPHERRAAVRGAVLLAEAADRLSRRSDAVVRALTEG